MDNEKQGVKASGPASVRRFGVRVDHGRCIASGRCVGVLPEVFFQTDEGFASARERYPPSQYHELVRSAADGCPAAAILLDEE
ncbi:MAG: ferredoxin [Steroidobacteraceae bacterium]